jgi:RNA polymerase sigma-70 factor, ECF subfamily
MDVEAHQHPFASVARRRERSPLLRRAQRGEDDALDALLREESPMIERICRRVCNGDVDVDYDDILQDTYLGIVQSLAKFRGDAALSTWVYTIARTSVSRVGRRRARYVLRGDPQLVPTSDLIGDPDAMITAGEVAEALRRALAGLSSINRSIVLLRDGEQLSIREVSRRLGLSESGVKARLHRARVIARRALRPLYEEVAAPRHTTA